MNENTTAQSASRAAPKRYVPPGTHVGVHFNSATGQYETLYAHKPPVSPVRTVAIALGILLAVVVVLLLVLTGGSDKGALPTAPSTWTSAAAPDPHPTTLAGLGRTVTAINAPLGAAFAATGTAEAVVGQVCQALPVLGAELTKAAFIDGFNSGSGYTFSPSVVSRYADAVIQYCQDTA